MKRILFLLFCLWIIPVQAADEERQVEAQGFGNTYKEAVANALLEAVRQVRGLAVGEEKNLRFDLISIISDDRASITGGTSTTTDIYTQSKGRIASYQILETREPTSDGKQWKVKVRAVVPEFKPVITGDKRASISVFAFRVKAQNISIEGDNRPAASISRRLADGISLRLTQAGGLAVLSRDYQVELANERALWATDQVNPREASRIGQILGADLVLLGTIHELDISKAVAELYGADFGGREIRVDLTYSLVETATQKIIWSDAVTFTRIVKEDLSLVKKTKVDYLANVITELANQVAIAVIDITQPMKIIKVESSDRILLNRSGEHLSVGDMYHVKAPGETVTDPDTGLKIYIHGATLATLEIVDIQTSYSVAKLVDGNLQQIDAGNIVRRAELDKTNKKVPAPQLTPGSSEKPINW